MRIVKGIIIFFGTFLLYHIIFSHFFPVDENNVLQAPDWYVYIGMAISIIVSIFSNRKKKENRKGFKKTSIFREIKIFVQERIEESNKIKEYDSLSESEKWKLEREDQKKNPQQFQIFVDTLTDSAAKVIFETGQASVSILQRSLHIGYAQAAMIMDHLEQIGIVGPFQGSTTRDILISQDAYRKNVKITDSASPETTPKDFVSGIDINQIIEDENKWRREQQGLSETDYELSKIDLMEGHEFEHWCADLLKKNGFSNVEVTVGSGDQGVDVLARKDGIRYAIQCKCYSKDLGNKPVQEVNTGKTIYHCQIGVVMTNRYFTKGAKDAADATGVLLWDRNKLKQMMGS